MALSFLTQAEQEKTVPTIANSISFGHSPKSDDKFITSSMYSSGSNPFAIARTRRTLSQEESASTESGDDDLSSVRSIPTSPSDARSRTDSEAGDDDKSLSPRSTSTDDVATCIYSVMFLMNVGVACKGRAERKSILGYRTELAPQSQTPTPTSTFCAHTYKPSHKHAKQAAKQRTKEASSALLRLPQQALPASTADSWVTKQRAAKATCVDDDAQVTRATRSILNKLTIERFDSLFDQLVACGIKTPYHVSMLMREVFEKATTQHYFIPMYAELCVRLENDPHIAYAVEQAGDHQKFRRLLLDECQNAFEQLLVPCTTQEVVDEELKLRRKQQALGNIKLVGELLVQGMLGSALLTQCSETLLQSQKTCPEALECLAALVVVAGPKFDRSEWQYHSSLEAVFSEMDTLTRDKSTPPRVRFLLRDVLDMRKAGWCTSVNQSAMKAAPMKLEEVRDKQAADEQAVSSPKRQTFGGARAALPVGEVCRNSMRKHEDTNVAARSKKKGAGKGTQKSSDSTDVVNSLRSLLGGNARVSTSQAQRQSFKDREIVEVKAPLEQPAPINKPLHEVPVIDQTELLTQGHDGFDIVTFRRALTATLTKLALDKNVPAAVQFIRLQEVPVELQANQFCDILSRIVEEKRGAVRRCELAFAAGLCTTEQSPFDKATCLHGISLFFQDVYAEMCTEVPRLPAIMRSEFVPMMSSVFQTSELNEAMPEDMRTLA